MQKMPQTRTSGLIVKEVDSEILIYDQVSNKAHCLNETAAKVWKHCDGKTTVAAACRSLSLECDSPVDETVVGYAINQFAKDHLLEDAVTPAFMISGLNRRQMVRTLGLAAAVAVPVVTSILAPTPAQAATCVPTGGACNVSGECCSGVCTGGPPGTCA